MRLATGLVRDLHAALMDRLAHDRGSHKTSSNVIAGASWRPASPERVPDLMLQGAEQAEQAEWQSANLNDEALLEAIANAHIAFARVHPFTDGDGRTGRAIIAHPTIRGFGFPAIVRVTQRAGYIAMLDTQDTAALTRLLAVSLANEAGRAATCSPSGRRGPGHLSARRVRRGRTSRRRERWY